MSKSPLWLQVSYFSSADGTYGFRLHFLYETKPIKEGKGYKTKSAAYSAGYRAKKRYIGEWK